VTNTSAEETQRIRDFERNLAFWRFIWRFLFLLIFPLPTYFQSHLNLTINTSKYTPHYRHSAKPFGPRRQDGTSLPSSVFQILDYRRPSGLTIRSGRPPGNGRRWRASTACAPSPPVPIINGHQLSVTGLHHRQPPSPIHVGDMGKLMIKVIEFQPPLSQVMAAQALISSTTAPAFNIVRPVKRS